MNYSPFGRVVAAVLMAASPLGIWYARGADKLPPNGIVYNIARVTEHNFVETRSSLKGDAVHIQAIPSNGDGGTFGRGPFAPIVTLAFSSHGKPTGELKLLFNVPASQKDQTHEIDIPGGASLWNQSDHIEASAANNLNARPTSGSWEVDLNVVGGSPVSIHPH